MCMPQYITAHFVGIHIFYAEKKLQYSQLCVLRPYLPMKIAAIMTGDDVQLAAQARRKISGRNFRRRQ